MKDPEFTFTPRWKEELVCSCSLGRFVLEMPMGVTSVYLPPEERWQSIAPEWARHHWTALHGQLSSWCSSLGYPLRVDGTAQVYDAD
jgi:hypothetical protein